MQALKRPKTTERRRITALAVLALALSACGGSGGGNSSGTEQGNSVPASQLTKTGTIRYVLEKNISNWNILTSDGNTFETAEVMNGILPGAFIPQPDFTVSMNKDLLVSAELTKTEPQTVVYKIQPKAVWSDGTPISADDFIYQWTTQNGVNTKYTVAGTTGYESIASVVGSDGGKTVTATFKPGKKFADWKSLFGALLPAQIMKTLSPDPVKAFNTGLLKAPSWSGGPFMISKFESNKAVTLVKNPKWYGEGPYLSTVIFRIITDATQEPTALANGEVDAIYPQPQVDLLTQVKKIPGVTANVGFGLLFEHFDLNIKNKFLADRELRRAIFTAVDREGLVNRTVKQFSSKATVLNNRMLLPGQPGYQDNVASKGFGKGDLAGAKKILTDAGYTGVGTALKNKAGQAVGPLRFRYTVGNQIRQTEGELLKATLAQLGITMNIQSTDDLGGTLDGRDFDIVVFGWVGSPFPYSSNQSIYSTRQGQNFGNYSNAQVDKWLADAAIELDASKAQELLNKADAQITEDAATLPLYQKPTLLAFYDKYGNVRDNATSVGPTYNIQQWGIKTSAG
ncbi:MAG: glutathione transport system substrate-binding protein [Frankiaceae bacterium]|jgi:peptide/nickel transport system substrate-binding protein|nr:glutathione transport system substrate-binding protein [Frankiaceae bacterium]MDX6223634.1 glutathione transport system substrate-binding protein [Frankiales bacterium]